MTALPDTNKILVAVVGPTASGKTSAAIELAQHFKTEILSFDARQFYREMTIGTAKPNAEELQAAPHHFIGQQSVTQPYTAGTFATDADALLKKLFETHDTVIGVGGSGLFVKAWIEGLDELPAADESIRKQLQNELNQHGIAALQQQLQTLDPKHYETVDRNNPRRLMRTLEVCIATGQPYSSLLTSRKKTNDYTVVKIGLQPPREDLYQRIDQRVDEMMQQGLLDEVRSLLPYRHLQPLHTVGYTELFQHLDGTMTLSETVEKIKQHTRNYAKRQITWFKKDRDVNWMERFDLQTALRLVAQSRSNL